MFLLLFKMLVSLIVLGRWSIYMDLKRSGVTAEKEKGLDIVLKSLSLRHLEI